MSNDKQTTAEEVKEEKTVETAEEKTIKEEPQTEETQKQETQDEASQKDETEKAPETGEKPEEKPEEKPTGEKKTGADALSALNDRYLRLCAEYDNFRKRSQKEKDALYADVKANTMKSFLPVYDNLVRALNQNTEDEAYKKGVEMIMAQFKATMEKLGVTEMECLGQKFDPAFHNAVMHVDDEEKGDNEIVEVFQQGFMLGDKVIRFAMVKVAN